MAIMKGGKAKEKKMKYALLWPVLKANNENMSRDSIKWRW
jgi:hypothetical protein